MRLARPLAVAGLAAGTLAYQILLTRAFAVAHYHHFAYMAIGVAMLGFGAAGTWLALARLAPAPATERRFLAAALVTPVTLIASPALVLRIPLDPTRLAWDAGQWPLLAALYLLLALPFLASALANLIALTLEPERLGTLYGAGFLGAGVGAAVAVATLLVAPPERALAAPAILASVGAGAAVVAGGAGRRWLAGAVVVAVVAVAAAAWRPPWRVAITPYKGLPQVEAYPGARRIAERTSPVGWVIATRAPAFRHAPGLSLAYRGAFPEQVGLFLDGEIAGAAAAWGVDTGTRAMLDWLPSALPYALGGRERVLVLGAGGGAEVWNASVHGAREITAVELSPDLARLGQDLGGTPSGPRVAWIVADARGFVARTRDHFDLITIGPGGAFGASVAGVHGLNEDFMHTVEAYTAYLRRLRPDGVLAVTRWIAIPPRASIRTILTAAEALRGTGASVDGALVVARSWATATILAKPGGFTREEVSSLRSWAAARNFDLDWYPGLASPTDGFHVLAEPTLFRAARAGAHGPDSVAALAAAYPFDVAPADDARPYPHHFLRARSVRAMLGAARGAWLPFAEWGYVALGATLLQSTALAAGLLVLPVALRRSRPRAAARIVAYFTAIGFAYLLAEIAAIQQLGLLLGHPVYAVAAALAALLVGSGVGGVWSDRLAARWSPRVAGFLGVGLAAYALALLAVVQALQETPLAARALAALALLAPLAVAMGMPFALGVRALTTDRPGLAWAWAANGFASVVAAPLAAVLALEFGSPALFAGSAAAYGLAAVLSAPARGA